MRTLLALLFGFGWLTASAIAHPGHHPHEHAESSVSTGEVAAGIDSHVEITERDGFRHIEANGLPNHETGRFPNRGNPNTIAAQSYHFRLPLQPLVAETYTPIGRQLFGVALNGVVFDPGTAEFWQNDRRSGWNYDALSGQIDLGLDDSRAHVQPGGVYHYHGIPTGLIDALGGNEEQMRLLGYAADGFPIYAPRAHETAHDPASPLRAMKASYRVREGVRRTGPGGWYDGTFVQDFEYTKGHGDLDAANGRIGVTPEYPEGTYYYVLTDDFPFIPRQFRGTPDGSFAKQGPPPEGRGPSGPSPRGNGPRRPPFCRRGPVGSERAHTKVAVRPDERRDRAGGSLTPGYPPGWLPRRKTDTIRPVAHGGERLRMPPTSRMHTPHSRVDSFTAGLRRILFQDSLGMPAQNPPLEKLPRTLRQIRDGLDRLHPGVQIYVSQGRRTIVDAAVGLAATGVPLTSDHTLAWLSAGKPLTAFAILQQVEAGRLDLDAPVVRNLPEFALHGKDTITLRHLLTHTAGIQPVPTGWPRASWHAIIARVCAAKLRHGAIPGTVAAYDPQRSWFVLGELLQRLRRRTVRRDPAPIALRTARDAPGHLGGTSEHR